MTMLLSHSIWFYLLPFILSRVFLRSCFPRSKSSSLCQVPFQSLCFFFFSPVKDFRDFIRVLRLHSSIFYHIIYLQYHPGLGLILILGLGLSILASSGLGLPQAIGVKLWLGQHCTAYHKVCLQRNVLS